MTRLRFHWPLLVCVVLFLVLGGAYSVINPLFESPDEVWHYEYVRWLVEGRGLPQPEQVGSAPWHQEGSQPPLYYLLGAAITWPIPTENAEEAIRYNPHAAVGQAEAWGNKNVMVHGDHDAWPWQGVVLAVHIARWFSLLLGALTVIATYGIAWAIWSRRSIAVMATVLVAFNPQFLFLSAAVNNDNLIIMLSSLSVWLCVILIGRETARDGEVFGLGILAGLAAVSKLSGLAVFGLGGLTVLILAWKVRSWRQFVHWVLMLTLGALVVGSWWYLRNLILYGDPLGLQAMFDILPRRAQPPSLAELMARAQGVWRSAWAVFGWFNVTVPEWMYAVYSLVSMLGAMGLILVWPFRRARARRSQVDNPPVPWAQLLLLAVWNLVMLVALVSWAQMRYPQGRLLFPAISAAAPLLAYGLGQWLSERWQRAMAISLSAILLGLAIYALIPLRSAYLPLYDPVNAPTQEMEAVFGDQIALTGYSIEEVDLQPGSDLHLTLTWRATKQPASDYSVFVHLVDDSGVVQGQHDSYPGAGSLPTSDWLPSISHSDSHRIHLPLTAPAPMTYRVRVGLYDAATGERLLVGDYDHWNLGELPALPRVGDSGLPNPIHINFDDKIALVGFELDSRAMSAGDVLTIDLWWQALQGSLQDYVVFTHLVLPPDAVWAGMDKPPEPPSSTWVPEQIVPDRHQLQLPAAAPPGVYFVEIGIYDPHTNDRLRVNFSDKGIVLGQIKVGE